MLIHIQMLKIPSFKIPHGVPHQLALDRGQPAGDPPLPAVCPAQLPPHAHSLVVLTH